MHFDVITSTGFPSELRDDWNRLAGDDPMASFEWRSAWWRVFGGGKRLTIALARHGGRLVGLAPCYTSDGPWRGRKLQFLGDGKVCTDYQRYLLDAALTAEQAAGIVDGLTEALVGGAALRRKQDLWELDGVSPTAALTTRMEESLRRRGFMLHAEPLESCWVTDLSDSWEAFKAASHRTLRRKISKAERRGAESDVAYAYAKTPSEIAAAWPEFVRLHELRFRDKVADGGCFADAGFAAFLPDAIARLAERSAARLVWCEVGGRPVSIQLYLLGGRTASMYQSGFDPDDAQVEPGYLLYTRVVRDLISEGYTKLDFLRGDEPYKAQWNARPQSLVRLFAVPPRRTSQLRHQTYQLARSLKRAARNSWNSRASGGAAAAPQSPHTEETAPSTEQA